MTLRARRLLFWPVTLLPWPTALLPWPTALLLPMLLPPNLQRLRKPTTSC